MVGATVAVGAGAAGSGAAGGFGGCWACITAAATKTPAASAALDILANTARDIAISLGGLKTDGILHRSTVSGPRSPANGCRLPAAAKMKAGCRR